MNDYVGTWIAIKDSEYWRKKYPNRPLLSGVDRIRNIKINTRPMFIHIKIKSRL
jgi:hypothetical protein